MAEITEDIFTPEAADFLRQWDDPSAFILAHTSGSTGLPKEINLRKEDMRVSARATNRRFGLGKGSLLVCPLSANYIAGKMMAVRGREAGCRVVFEAPSNQPLKEDYGTIDLLAVVPSQCQWLLKSPNAAKIRNVIVGGAPISPALEEQLCHAPFHTFATYGMTETCSHVALRPVGKPLFEAMPGVEFAVDNRNCLTIKAPAYSFKTLQTNDIVELRSPTTFRWRGRQDNAINTGGLKVFPEEVERLLAPYLSVAFYISSLPDPKWGSRVVAYLESATQRQVEELETVASQLLPPHQRPKQILVLKQFERTPSGKIIRRRE